MLSRRSLVALAISGAAAVLLVMMRALPNYDASAGHSSVRRGAEVQRLAASGSAEASSDLGMSASAPRSGREVPKVATPSNPDDIAAIDDASTVLLVVLAASGKRTVGGAKVLMISTTPPSVVERHADAGGKIRVPAGAGVSYVLSSPGFVPVEVHPILDADVEVKRVRLGGFAAVFGKVAVPDGVNVSVELLLDVTPAISRNSSALFPYPRSMKRIASVAASESGEWEIPKISVYSERGSSAAYRVRVASGETRRLLPASFPLQPGDRTQVEDPWLDRPPLDVQLVYPSGAPLGARFSVDVESRSELLGLEQPSLTARPRPVVTSTGKTAEGGWVRLYVTPGSQWHCTVDGNPRVDISIPTEPPFRAVMRGYECVMGQIVDASTGTSIDLSSVQSQELSATAGWIQSEEPFPKALSVVTNGKFTIHMMKASTKVTCRFDQYQDQTRLTTKGVPPEQRTARAGARDFRLPIRSIAQGQSDFMEFESNLGVW